MNFMYKTLNNIQTHLLTWGDPFDCNGSDVIVCITGNPGVPDFYTEFGTELHRSTGLPVCVIGHAGHSPVPDKESNVLENKEHLFNLEGQVKHKLDLMSNHIDKKSKMHLIGHSVGAWMAVESLQRAENLSGRIASVTLLFPTLQKMSETKNGKFINEVIRKVHSFLIFLYALVYYMPNFLFSFLIGLYIRYYSLPKHYLVRIQKFLHYKVGEKILYLAYDEMDNVNELNIEAIEKIKHLTYVIYSNRDGWAPIDFMNDLKTFSPPLQMKEVNINHSFVLKSSERVADMVAEVIKTKMENNKIT